MGVPEVGNLDYQTVSYENGAKTSTETYWYDGLHRLKRSERSFTGVTHSEAPLTYDYDAVGNLEQKSDYASTLSYGGIGKSNAGNAGPNAVLSITKPDNSTANYTYDNNGNVTSGDGKTITYNAFNKPNSISKGGINSTFAYGADLMRFKQVKTGLPEGDETTIYLDKMVEIVEQGGSTITRTYIDDIAIISKEEIVGQPLADHKIRFTLRDRLGSLVTLVDHNNQITEHRSYDPFGKPRTGDFMDVAVSTLREAALSDPHSGDVIDNIPFTNRGFTDHEHLDDAELIHMNGRAYDYNLGRFLSVDPFIQEPGNSQSMNPYSYIMNNPLSGTDPSGYLACDVTEQSCKDQLQKCGPFCLDASGGDTVKAPDDNGHKNVQGGVERDGNTKPEEIGGQSQQDSLGESYRHLSREKDDHGKMTQYGIRYKITGSFLPPGGDVETGETGGTSDEGSPSTTTSTVISGVAGVADIAKAVPHPLWVGTVSKGSGVLGTGLKAYSSKWGGNGTTGGKTQRISQAKSTIGKIGKGLVFLGAFTRGIEAISNIRNAKTQDERINEVGDAGLDIAFGLAALIPGPGWIISLSYFAIDNFILEDGVFRTVRNRLPERKEDDFDSEPKTSLSY